MKKIIVRCLYLLPVLAAGTFVHLLAGRQEPKASAKIEAPNIVANPILFSDTIRGWEVYNAHDCSSCHSVDGVGNAASPLDDVGARRRTTELREWITGTGSAAERLPPAVKRRKQRYQDLPEADIKALVVYLTTLTTKPE